MRKRNSQRLFWLLLSLIVPLYFGLISLHHAVTQAFMVQDDARLHIVWLQQFVDPDLFANDLIAQYYQTIQAAGFQALYWGMAKLGIEPLILAKLLPTGLALITTGYLFHLTLHLLPHPACAFLTTLLLNQNIWLKDDLISATPRAFIYPLFAAFLYYLVRRSAWGCWITIGLMGLFYPQLVLVELGILTLRLLPTMIQAASISSNLEGEMAGPIGSEPPALTENERRQFRRSAMQQLRLWLVAIGVAVLVMLPFQQHVAHEFGSLLSAAQMQQMPEFGPNGRREYFGVDPVSFMFRGASGVRLPLFPPILWVGVALPFVLHLRLVRVQVSSELKLLAEIVLASLVLFLLAHLLFPKLYLPSRYTFYSLRVVMALAAGIVLFWVVAAASRAWRSQVHRSLKHKIIAGLALSFLAAVVTVPAIPALFLSGQGWVIGEQPNIYRFFAAQPKATLIASLAAETDNIPAFTQRSVLVSRELALAYHPGFYNVMQQRIVDLVKALYSSNLAETQAVLQQYGIDFLLLERQFANPDYLTQQDWLIHSSFQPVILDTVSRLKQGAIPALSRVIDRCTALSEDNLIILKAACISRIQSE